MTLITDRVDLFFSTARERHSIYLKRKAGLPYPWSEDPIFNRWRFCCVFRELDKTTAWFRENIREPMRSKPEVLLATVVFRLFNRIGVGESIFKQIMLGEKLLGKLGSTAWDLFLQTGDTDYLKWSILNYVGARGPYVTGSYIVKTPDGYNKLDGVLKVIEWFCQKETIVEQKPFPLWRHTAEGLVNWYINQSLQMLAEWLERNFEFIGHFTAYEIVSDLRHTDLLKYAEDILTWANPGPGATKGLNYLHGRDPNKTSPKSQLVEEMRELLALSRDASYWPQGGKATAQLAKNALDWPKWEMREVEHFNCELAKYVRARDTGQGTRQRFRPPC